VFWIWYYKAMHCPDCGQNLNEVSVTGFDKSFRCENCGGFLLAGWVANRVAEGQMKNDIKQLQPDIEKFTGKTNLCPMDGAPLFGYSGEDMPPEVPALKCSHCGQWWFGDNSLFKFKSAYEAKVSYEKLWKKRAPMMVMALPVLMVLILAITLGITVNNINKPQSAQTQASEGSEQLNAQYLGGGKELIRFKTAKIGLVLYKGVSEEIWNPVEVLVSGEGWYKINLINLKQYDVYEIQINGKKYYFKTQ
jgi:hypothetical protein